jgi:hypothetical protein
VKARVLSISSFGKARDRQVTGAPARWHANGENMVDRAIDGRWRGAGSPHRQRSWNHDR